MSALILSFLRAALPGLIAVGLLLGIYTAGYWKGSASNEAEWQAKLQAQENEAFKQQQKMQEKVNEVTTQLQADKRAINGRLMSALDELRNRPTARLPESSRAACAGATGAELSQPDSRFLVGEAARADQLRADLKACRAYIEVIKAKSR